MQVKVAKRAAIGCYRAVIASGDRSFGSKSVVTKRQASSTLHSSRCNSQVPCTPARGLRSVPSRAQRTVGRPLQLRSDVDSISIRLRFEPAFEFHSTAVALRVYDHSTTYGSCGTAHAHCQFCDFRLKLPFNRLPDFRVVQRLFFFLFSLHEADDDAIHYLENMATNWQQYSR